MMKKKRSNCPGSNESIYSRNIKQISGHFPRQNIPGTLSWLLEENDRGKVYRRRKESGKQIP
jgi:hypothetical protein